MLSRAVIQVRFCSGETQFRYWRKAENISQPLGKQLPTTITNQTWKMPDKITRVVHRAPKRASRLNNKEPEIVYIHKQQKTTRGTDSSLADALRRKYKSWQPRSSARETRQLMAEMLADVDQYNITGLKLGVQSTVVLTHKVASFGAVQLLKKLLEIIPLNRNEYNSDIHTNILHCYATSRDVTIQDICRVWDEIPMLKRNEEGYNVLIGVYIKANMKKEAKKLLQDMEERRIKPSNVTKTILLKLSQNYNELEENFYRIKKPTERQYTAFIQCAVPFSHEAVEKAIKHMDDAGVKKNRFVYNMLVHSYSKVSNWEMMKNTYETSLKENQFDHVTFDFMMKWCRNKTIKANDDYSIFAERIMSDAKERKFNGEKLKSFYTVLLAKVGKIDLAIPLYFQVYNGAADAIRRNMVSDLQSIAGYKQFPPAEFYKTFNKKSPTDT